ncbi:MAG: DUF411 domain-containing protein [Gemmatimonadaceae bacterium]
MMRRREWFHSLIAVAASGLPLSRVLASGTLRPIEIDVYKKPNCNCCAKWVEHIRAAGFSVRTHDVEDTGETRKRLGVPDHLLSCHTAFVDGYVVEGHVPSDLVERMLREKPDIVGIAVPLMPVGSPGMEVPGEKENYDVIAFERNGSSRVYATR